MKNLQEFYVSTVCHNGGGPHVFGRAWMEQKQGNGCQSFGRIAFAVSGILPKFASKGA